MSSLFFSFSFLLLSSFSFFTLAGDVFASPAVSVIEGSTRKICQLTGDFDPEKNQSTSNQSSTRFRLPSTDLGASFDFRGKTYFLFGDTPNSPSVGKPVDSDSIATTTDTNPEDCLDLNWITETDGSFRPIQVPGIRLEGFEVPSGGFSLNDKIYIFLTTDHSAQNVMGRSILASSTDEGLSFRNFGTVSQTKFINVSPVTVDAARFRGLPVRSGPGVLLWGSGKYRESNPYLAFSAAADVENPARMKYFAGLDPRSRAPIWSGTEQEAAPLFQQPCLGEFSVQWLPSFRKWLMAYNCGAPRGVNFRVADQPWGPWTEPQILFDPWRDQGYCHFMHANYDWGHCDSVQDRGRDREWGGEYGPYLINRFTRAVSRDSVNVYYTLSTWNPYAVVLMKSTLRMSSSSTVATP